MPDPRPDPPAGAPLPPQTRLQQFSPLDKYTFLFALGAGILIGLVLVLWPGGRHQQPAPVPVSTVVTATPDHSATPTPYTGTPTPTMSPKTPVAVPTPIYLPNTGTGGLITPTPVAVQGPNTIRFCQPEGR